MTALTCDSMGSASLLDGFIATIGQYSRALPTKIGYAVNSTFPGLTSLSNISNIYPYVYSCLGFGATVLAAAAILIVLYIIGSSFSCLRCMQAKDSRRVKCCDGGFHIANSLGLFASAIILYISSSAFEDSAEQIKTMPTDINNSVNLLITTFDVAVLSFSAGLRSLVGNANTTLNSFASFATNEYSAIKLEASALNSSTGTLISDFSSGDYYNYASQFDSNFSSILSDCGGGPLYSLASLGSQLPSHISRIYYGPDEVNQMQSNFTDASANVTAFLNSGYIDVINQNVNSFFNSTVSAIDFSNFTAIVDNFTRNYQIYFSKFGSYASTLSYLISSIVAVIAVCYCLVYFMRNVISRAAICAFWPVGLTLTIILVIPGAFFAAIFYPIHEICPNVETQAQPYLGGLIGSQYSLKQILTCSAGGVTELYSLLNLSEYVDFQSLENYINGNTSGSFSASGIGAEANQILDTYASQYLTPEYLFGVANVTNFFSAYNQYIQNVYQLSGVSASCSADRIAQSQSSHTGRYNSALYAYNSDIQLAIAMIANATNITSFASQIQPFFSNITEILTNTGGYFVAGANTTLESSLEDLNCTFLCSMYVPTKNAICVSFLNGISAWILSSMLASLCLFMLAFTLACRRCHMQTPQVSPGEDIEIDFEMWKYARNNAVKL